MTIGDQIWADAVRRTGILDEISALTGARWREFALTVIRAINESHGLKEEEEE